MLIASVWGSKDSTVTNAVAEDNYLARTFQRKFFEKKCAVLCSSLLFSKLPQSNHFKIRIISTTPYLLDKTHKPFPPHIPKKNCKPRNEHTPTFLSFTVCSSSTRVAILKHPRSPEKQNTQQWVRRNNKSCVAPMNFTTWFNTKQFFCCMGKDFRAEQYCDSVYTSLFPCPILFLRMVKKFLLGFWASAAA